MMRALRVVGLDEDGVNIVLEDPERGERFSLSCDERLRAAVRGDTTRLGQAQIELESQMRPREIQARIRAGESVDQLALAAGVPTQKIERYAYPVLLERSRTAELAQQAHPVREDGPDVQTLGEVVAHGFGLRGQDYTDVHWDSWRGEDNKWVVQLAWRAGRSENRAHWVFHPGAHGGTVTALDEHAADLLDPNPSRALRTVRPVTQLAKQALRVEDEAAQPLPEEPPAAPEPPAEPVGYRVDRSSNLPFEPPTRTPVSKPAAAERPAPEPKPEPEPEPVKEQPAETAASSADTALAKRAEPAQRRGKKNHPIVPSWEDVLLGVRSQRG